MTLAISAWAATMARAWASCIGGDDQVLDHLALLGHEERGVDRQAP